MLKIKFKKRIIEAEGDSEPLVGINMDYLKKKNPKRPDQNPKEYYMDLQLRAKSGVDDMFSKRVIDFIENLNSEYLPETGKKYFVKWLGNSIKNGNTPAKLEDVRYVKDYFEGTNASELPDNFFDAYKKSEEWHEELARSAGQIKGGYKTNEVVHDFGNGYKIVRMAWDTGPREDVKHDLLLEGDKMGNCVGKLHCKKILKSGESIFSLRDRDNEPHVTMNIFHDTKNAEAYKYVDPEDEQNYGDDDDWDDDDDGLFESYILNESYIPDESDHFDEIKGKQNKPPEEKYESMIVPWIVNTFKPKQYIDAEGGYVVKSKFFDISGLEGYIDQKVTRKNYTLLKAIIANPKIESEKVINFINRSKNEIKNSTKDSDDPYYVKFVLNVAYGNENLPLDYLLSELDKEDSIPESIISNPSFTKEAAYKILKEKDYKVNSSRERDIFSQIVRNHVKDDVDTMVLLYERNKKPSKIPMKKFLGEFILNDKFPVDIKIDAFMNGIYVNSSIVESIVENSDSVPDKFYKKILQYLNKGLDLSSAVYSLVKTKSTPIDFIKEIIELYEVKSDNETLIWDILHRPDLPEDLFIEIAGKVVDTIKDYIEFRTTKVFLCANPDTPSEILNRIVMEANLDIFFMKLIENPSVTAEMLAAKRKKTKSKLLIPILDKGIEMRKDPNFGKEENDASVKKPKQMNESKILKKMMLLAGIQKY